MSPEQAEGRGRAAQRCVQPRRRAGVRRHRPGTVRHRIRRRPAVPAGSQPAGPGPGSRRGPAPDRTLPGQDPGGRPSPGDLLAELGDAALAPGWRPASLDRHVSPARGGPGRPVGRGQRRPGRPCGQAPPRSPARTRAATRSRPGPGASCRAAAGGRAVGGDWPPSRRARRVTLAAKDVHRRGRHRRRRAPGRAGPAEDADPPARLAHGHREREEAAGLARCRQARALSPARLTGTWTGTYFCPQGWTGLRLVLKAASNGTLAATFDFYPIDGDPGVPSGSFTLTGSY